ncbi:MAG: arginase family protein [Bacteroidota bacterium]|nr:arginase family protein [Bacteroidota bacterium]
MELLDFFEPLDMERFREETYEEGSWYYALDIHGEERPDLGNKKIAILGISGPDGMEDGCYEIRKYLYHLKRAEYADEVVDLGNFRYAEGDRFYQSLGYALSELINMELLPVIINGPHDVTYSQYLAFTYLKRYVNLVCFDARIDFNLREITKIDKHNFLQKVLLEDPSYLFGYTHIGYQSHFADTGNIDFLQNLHFDLFRLGDARANISDMEPVLRSAHFASWDVAAIRQSDAPGAELPSPNGFHGEEACLLCRYAGLGSSLKSMGFYNYDIAADRGGQTAHLVAQMVWYTIDGWLNRQVEHPLENHHDFTKFITNLHNNGYQIVFYKSNRTNRWWMEVPIDEKEYKNSHHIMPCSYNDYLSATREEIPERWWHAMRKLN